MRSLSEIYESFGMTIAPEHAPYIDEQTAEYERIINELSEEVERLNAENKALRDGGNNSGMDSDDDSVQTRNLGEFEATFYTAFCPTGCTGITATGIDVRNTIYHEGKRIIVVDPNAIPLGSHVRVTLEDGTSFEATAQDTGGAIKDNRIDILVASRDGAYKLGRQSAKVGILK